MIEPTKNINKHRRNGWKGEEGETFQDPESENPRGKGARTRIQFQRQEMEEKQSGKQKEIQNWNL